MNYIVLLCDGMADLPFDALGGKTPAEVADKPHMDELAQKAEVGTVRTVPDGLAPGSDVANLAVLGYDTRECYTGRSPLEAANIGIDLSDDDVALRCNLVTLSDDEPYESKTILDYCAGDIPTPQADEIIKTLQSQLGGGEFDFYTGTAYRHCLVWHGGKTALGKITPPHDITGRVIGEYVPADPNAAPLLDLMKKSVAILKDHPVNIRRRATGQNPANAIWLWGHGKRPSLENFQKRYGLPGSMISAVDLLKGIGRIAGMNVCAVDGATGYIDTNYEGKLQAAIDELDRGQQFVYIHLEGPDECGHRGEAQNKVKAIEDIDKRLLAPLLDALRARGDFKILILPDHPTPLTIRTHSREPVPYLLYQSNREQSSGVTRFTEAEARKTGMHEDVGYRLLYHMLEK